ncbi:MAG: cupin domain-containing protein [Mycobacteriaceae bacterium]|jgi:quercetin dioxygenase-like cupin family protein
MEKRSLTALAREELQKALAGSSGRSAHTVFGGHTHTLRQTLVALRSGSELAEHESSGDSTVHVLQGRVKLNAGDDSWEGLAGDLLTIPPMRHSLDALTDAVVLLTVSQQR